MKTTSPRVALTKQLLKEGLLRLLNTTPLDKISITQLCRESGINRATFYRHYELPRDILEEIHTEFVENMLEHFNRPLVESDVEAFFAYLAQNADLIKIFVLYCSDTDLTRMFNTLYQNILREQSYEIKVLQGLDEESCRLLCTYLSGGAYFLMRQWLMEDVPKSPKEIASIALKIIDKDAVFR